MGIYYVYAYFLDGLPIYIGAGHGKRCWAHLAICRRRPTKGRWQQRFHLYLRKLLAAGITPTARQLLTGLSRHEALNIWEPFFIKALGRRGHKMNHGPLYNDTDGGEGQNARSIESAQRASASMKKARQRYKARYMRALMNPVVRAKKSATLKAQMQRPDTVAKRTQLWATQEHHQHLSQLTRDGLIMAGAMGPQRKSRYTGVRKRKDCNLWEARIRIGKREQKTLGYFPTELEAARAYNKGVDEYKNGVGRKNRVNVRRKGTVSVVMERRSNNERRIQT